MATTSLWRVTSSKGEKGLSQLIDYVKNPEKVMAEAELERDEAEDGLKDLLGYVSRAEATEKGYLVSGIWCSTDGAFDEMMSVKRRWGKEGGTIAYHGYQSFAEGEVSPEEAHRIGVELAEKLWGSRFQVLVSTHTDKQSHIHNHFVINTVSFVDGKKFYRSVADYAAMRKESDRLCRERSLSVVKEPKAKGVGYREWSESRSGEASTVRSIIRRDIDLAISESDSWLDFMQSMEGFGYSFKLYRKNGELLERPSLKPPDGERYMRFYKLGIDYDVDRILERILGHEEPAGLAYTERETQLVSAYWRMNRPRKAPHTLQGLYQRYIFELRVVRKWSHVRRALPMETRAAAARLEAYNRQLRLLKEAGIETLGELDDYREKVKGALAEAECRRGQIRNSLRSIRRGPDADGAEALFRQLKECSTQIRTLKIALKDLDEVEERSIPMQEEINVIDAKWAEYEERNPEPPIEYVQARPGRNSSKTRKDVKA